MIWFYILILILSCFLLIKSGTWLVKSLTKIARTLRWGEFLVSFCLLAITSSLPELFIGLSSAFHKLPQLSFGNIIGANIINLTLGIGIAALLLKGLKIESKAAKSSLFYATFFVSLPLLLILDGTLSRFDGIVLLLALGFYFRQIISKKERFSKTFLKNSPERVGELKFLLKDLGTFFASLALLLLSAETVVRTINFLAVKINLPLVTAGIFFLAIGTTLPELTFGIRAAKMKHKEMVLGNFIGTIIINSTLILGIVALISPLKIINFSPYIVGILFTFIVAVAFSFFARTHNEINKREAYILISIYFIFALIQILI